MTDSKNTYDIALLGWWYGKNYGSMLTYYGLNRAIRSLGRSVLMVHEPLGYNGFRVQWPADIVSMEFARRVGYDYTEQKHFSELSSLNEVAGTFVVGSDQLWNPLIGRVNDDLFLDFVDEKNHRVAYGTSFGNPGAKKFSPEFVAKHAANLEKFTAISVREEYAVRTAREVFGVTAELVVDPVFLLPAQDYSDLADQATITPEGDYLAVFFLDLTEEKKRVAQHIADKLGLDGILVIPNPDVDRAVPTDLFADEPRARIMAEDRPENFLRAYRDSSYVVTDSFHGSAFASIFEKPFSSIYNTKRGAGRFRYLLSSLGFGQSRRVHETDTADDIAANPDVSFEIDFTGAREYIDNGRVSSMRWLERALDPANESSAKIPRQHATVDAPVFTARNDAWHVSRSFGAARLRVARGGDDLGNHVWTQLPAPLVKGANYELTIDWTPRTAAPAINLHLRNPATGRFRVIGTVEMGERPSRSLVAPRPRTDTFRFRVPEEGLSQVMLGALHFRGRRRIPAGAWVRRIELEQLPPSPPVGPAPATTKKAPAKGFEAQSQALAMRDWERQVRSHRHARSAQGLSGARARMIFHAHAIEKGLSHSTFRPGFGKIAVPGLAKEMNDWLAKEHDRDDSFLQSSAAVMKSYFDRHAALDTDVSHFRELFSEASQDLIDRTTHREGGVLPAGQVREVPEIQGDGRSFMDIVYDRRSVREYTDQPVRDEEIAAAVQIAMQSPSVCNRQSARVHQFEDPDVIKAVLDVQGGFGGYAMPPRLLLVTSDIDAFMFAPERNQGYVDGGLFMMSLLLGLTQVGLGSVSLNTDFGTAKETKVRKLIDIPDHEVLISFIGVGHYADDVLVPRSKRTGVDQILTLHEKG
jgi:nitroreductase